MAWSEALTLVIVVIAIAAWMVVLILKGPKRNLSPQWRNEPTDAGRKLNGKRAKLQQVR